MNELPRGWAWTTLGEIAETKLGKMLSAKARGGNRGRPYLRNKNVQWGRIDLDDVLRMDFSDAEFEKFRLQAGDLLVCEGGEVGRAAIWRGGVKDCAYQKALHRVRPLGGVLPEYLLYLLMHYANTHAFERYVTGSTIAHLPQEDLRQLPVALPPLAEQRRIVAAIEEPLSRVEVARDSLLAARKRSLALQTALSLRAFSNGRELELHDVATFVRGVTYKKQDARSEPHEGYLPLLRATNINGRLLLDRELVYVLRSKVADEQVLQYGDVVIATSSGSASVVGKSAPLQSEWVGTFGAFCAVLRPHSVVDPLYLAMYCSSPAVRKRWSDVARGTNINNLRADHILSTQIRLPSLEAQQRVAESLSQQMSRASVVLDATRNAERRSVTLRKAILACAFRGALARQDPRDEPAAALLDRIAADRATAPKSVQKRRPRAPA